MAGSPERYIKHLICLRVTSNVASERSEPLFTVSGSFSRFFGVMFLSMSKQRHRLAHLPSPTHMFLKIRGPQNPFQIPISATEIHDSGNPNVEKDSYIGTTLEGEGLLISVAFGHGGPGHRLAKVYLILEYFGPGQPSSAASPMPPSLTSSRCLLLDQAVPGCKMLKISKSAMLSKAHGKALAFVIAAVIFSGILRFLLPG